MNCDMCGKETKLFRTMVEGAEMNVCETCGRFGKVIGKTRTREEIKQEDARIMEFLQRKKTPHVKDIETNERVIDDYNVIIKQKRESMHLTQEELAKKLNEKESMIHKIENGHYHPPLELARKLEKHLGIKLVEHVKDEGKAEKTEGGAMTIGDILNLKKK